jgi:hypothetical protein
MKKLLILLFVSISGISVPAQSRTVTNADLEKFRAERQKAEDDYRKNYAQMGFPSPEELEKINAQKRLELEQAASRIRQQKSFSDGSIRERADMIRSQIASVESQIEFLRRYGGYNSNQTVYAGFGSYGYQNRRRPFQPPTQLPPNFQTVQDISKMYPNSIDVYNRSIGNYAFLNQRPRFGRFYQSGYFLPLVVGNRNYAPGETSSQLIYLGQVRAGLYAQWRLIEEEARRAGIRID